MANIILADDNPDQLLGMVDIFEAGGNNVEAASDGDEAIAIIQRHVRDSLPIDLVLTDMFMPRVNGLEVAAAAKAAGAKKIIISSARYKDIPPMDGVTVINKVKFIDLVPAMLEDLNRR